MSIDGVQKAIVLLMGLAVPGCAAGARSAAPSSVDGLLSATPIEGMNGWTDKEGSAPGAWFAAGDVSGNPTDDRRLETQPGGGVLVNGDGRTVNLFSAWPHGDVALVLEFMIPRGSNSGVYLMGRYEVQIFDSHGVAKPEHKDCGGIYQRFVEAENRGHEGHAPLVNASRPHGQWQTLDIVFRAPRFDGEKKIANARFERVLLNGVLVQRNVEVTGPTRSAAWDDEVASDRLMLQGDHGPVAYRNIRVRHLR